MANFENENRQAVFNRWLKKIAGGRLPDVCNPWRERNQLDLRSNGPRQRLVRLRAHLANPDARFLLVGEAAGYQGAKYSGIPFTSERLLAEGVIPRLEDCAGKRLTARARPFSEPSATTIWGTLADLGIASQIVLWNAFPWHPHKDTRDSNRTPTRSELALGLELLNELIGCYPQISLVAVGRKSEASLSELGVDFTPVRHPSMGGARAFRAGLSELIAAR